MRGQIEFRRIRATAFPLALKYRNWKHRRKIYGNFYGCREGKTDFRVRIPLLEK